MTHPAPRTRDRIGELVTNLTLALSVAALIVTLTPAGAKVLLTAFAVVLAGAVASVALFGYSSLGPAAAAPGHRAVRGGLLVVAVGSTFAILNDAAQAAWAGAHGPAVWLVLFAVVVVGLAGLAWRPAASAHGEGHQHHHANNGESESAHRVDC